MRVARTRPATATTRIVSRMMSISRPGAVCSSRSRIIESLLGRTALTDFHFRDSPSFARASGLAKKRVRPQSRHTTTTNLAERTNRPRPAR